MGGLAAGIVPRDRLGGSLSSVRGDREDRMASFTYQQRAELRRERRMF
jgi:hypothetical protein